MWSDTGMTKEQAVDIGDVFRSLSFRVYDNAVQKGFWDEPRNKGELVALMHSELSELLEGIREGNPESTKIPGFSSEEEELADLIIRALDYAYGFDLDLAGAIIEKHYYNTTRPRKHGKQF